MPDIVVVLLPWAMLVRAYLGTGSSFAQVPVWIWTGCEPFWPPDILTTILTPSAICSSVTSPVSPGRF